MSEAGKIVRALLKTRMGVSIVDMPEDGSKIGVRLLSDAEVAEANVEAYAVLSKQCSAKGVDAAKYIDAHPDAFNRVQMHAMLARCLRDNVDHSKPLFEGDRSMTAPEAIASLDVSYVNALWNVYLDHQDRLAPAKVIEESEVPSAVAALVENVELEYALAQMDAATLVRMMRYTLRLARNAAPKSEG